MRGFSLRFWHEQGIIDLWDTHAPAFGMNSSCEAYYGKPGAKCEQPGTNPNYTVGPEEGACGAQLKQNACAERSGGVGWGGGGVEYFGGHV